MLVGVLCFVWETNAQVEDPVLHKETPIDTSFSRYDEIAPVMLHYHNEKESVVEPQVMGEKVLQRLNNYSVADAVRYFSGVQLKDYGGVGGLKTVDIRGMGSQHVGVFYDGIQITNAQNGIVDLGKFSVDDLEQIELYNGQKSTIFQSARDFGTSGQIYLQPKQPTFKKGKSTHLIARYKMGSIKTVNPSFRWEQKITPYLSSSLSGEYMYTDGIYKFKYQRKYPSGEIAYDTTANRHNSELHAGRVEWGLFYDDKKGTEWGGRLYSYLSKRGIPGAIINNNFGEDHQKLTDRNLFAQAHWKKRINARFKTQLKAKFAYDYNRYLDTLAPQKPKIDNTYIQREWYLSSSSLYQITPNWSANLAVDFQYNTMSADLYNFSQPTRYTTLAALATNYRLGRFNTQVSLLGTFVNNDTKRNKTPRDETKFTPAVFVSYRPLDEEDLKFHAFYKQMFRLPTFNELYYKVLGVSMLNPEFTTQYDIGLEYTKRFENSSFKNFQLKVDGYYNDVKDKITASFNGNMFIWMNLGLGKVEIKGLDVQMQTEWNMGDFWIRPLLAYTYMQARDLTDSGKTYYGDLIPYSPRNSLSFAAMMDYKNWGLNYSFTYAGNRYDANQDNIQYNYLPPWYTHDLSLQKSFHLKKMNLTAALEVNNVLDQYYDVILNYPMPGRNYRLILKIEL